MLTYFLMDFLGIFGIILINLRFFYFILFFFSYLLRVLIKVTKVTTEQQKWPKTGKKKSIIGPFLREGLKKP